MSHDLVVSTLFAERPRRLAALVVSTQQCVNILPSSPLFALPWCIHAASLAAIAPARNRWLAGRLRWSFATAILGRGFPGKNRDSRGGCYSWQESHGIRAKIARGVGRICWLRKDCSRLRGLQNTEIPGLIHFATDLYRGDNACPAVHPYPTSIPTGVYIMSRLNVALTSQRNSRKFRSSIWFLMSRPGGRLKGSR